MAFRFYIADPTDDTYATSLVDFLGFATPDGTGFTVADGTIDFGEVPLESTILHQPPSPGGIVANAFYPETTMTFTLMSRHASYDDLVDDVQALATALTTGGVIVWQPEGATEERYIDFYPSPLPALWHGQPLTMTKLTVFLRDGGALDLSITRFPLMRGPNTMVVTNEAISNATLDGTISFTNPGNVESPMKLTVRSDQGGAELVEARVARKSKGDLTDFASLYQFDPTLENTDLPKFWRRVWRKVINPSTSDGLEGTYRFLQSVKLLESKQYRFQLRWGMVDQQPMGAQNRVIDLDNTDYLDWANFADVPFGMVHFDRAGAALVLEMWGLAPDDDAPTLDFGTATLMPADEQLSDLCSPGFKGGRFGREDIWGNMLDVSSGTEGYRGNDDAVMLHKTGAHAAYTAGVLPSGKHFVTFRGHLIRGGPVDDDATNDVVRAQFKLGELQVYEGGVLTATTGLRVMSGHSHQQFDHDNEKRVVFEADGSSSYQFRVAFTGTQGLGRRIVVEKLVHHYIPFADNGRQMVTDSFERSAYMADSGGSRWFPLHVMGALPKAAPGTNLLVVRLGDNPHSAHLTDIFDRGPLARTVPGRSARVDIEITPYYTH